MWILTAASKLSSTLISNNKNKWNVVFTLVAAIMVLCLIPQSRSVRSPTTPQASLTKSAFRSRERLVELTARFHHEEMRIWKEIEKDYGRYAHAIFKRSWRHDAPNRQVIKPVTTNSTGNAEAQNYVRDVIAQKLLQSFLKKPSSSPTRLVWTTAGDSRAAGHGNMHHESYTKVLERRIQPLFEALGGIQFEGRNHGMLGQKSAPEPAFCADSLYGRDTDLLAWDASMTDGSNPYSMGFLMAKAYFSFQPVLLALQLKPKGESRSRVLKSLDSWGIPVLVQDRLSPIVDQIPDTSHRSTTQISQMPRMVRHFKCSSGAGPSLVGENLLENSCGTGKWNNSDCRGRKFQFAWHSGYKHHALQGNLYALFLVEQVREALILLDTRIGDLPKLAKELELERSRRLQAVQSQQKLPDWVSTKLIDPASLNLVDPVFLLTRPNLCHTARLPSQIRAKGILESGKAVGHMTAVADISSDKMALTFDGLEREYCPGVDIRLDYDDYFTVASKGGITLPTQSEYKAYPNLENLQGFVGVCLAKCHYQRGCLPEEVRMQHLFGNSSTALHSQLEVNGILVTDVLQYWDPKRGSNYEYNDCVILRHKRGAKFPVKHGRFNIRAAVPEGRIIRFSSFVHW